MDRTTQRLIALGAIGAPALHTATDMAEWLHGGFTPAQLWSNYLAFLPMPALMLGLYAVQRPRISSLGLGGALLYGIAFVYFAHTTLVALDTNVPNYEQLWIQLGDLYTAHGVLMLLGGVCFGCATWRAGVLPRWTALALLGGLLLNLVLALARLPDLLQTLGTLFRNAGLVGMGLAVLRQRAGARAAA